MGHQGADARRQRGREEHLHPGRAGRGQGTLRPRINLLERVRHELAEQPDPAHPESYRPGHLPQPGDDNEDARQDQLGMPRMMRMISRKKPATLTVGATLRAASAHGLGRAVPSQPSHGRRGPRAGARPRSARMRRPDRL
jgi:hypothetical protein